MNVRACQLQDIERICEIYNHYIENTIITFEETPLSIIEMKNRIEAYTKLYPWLVCELQGEVIGYAYGSKWKERSAYRNTVEVTVYIKHGHSRNGYGKILYENLLFSLKALDCHVVLGCVALPNENSQKLHEYFGFKKVAHFSEVGRKFNRRIDVGYWQKILS
jgi:phosphinothricin acetyltransferase